MHVTCQSKTIKVKHCRWENIFSSINDPAPLYNLRQNLQTLQHQKGMTHIQHSNLTSDPFCANVDDIVHKMTISPSILLLITCICNCQFDAGKSISIRCRRYQLIKVRQRQDKTIFLRNNVSMIMVCPGACEMISI